MVDLLTFRKIRFFIAFFCFSLMASSCHDVQQNTRSLQADLGEKMTPQHVRDNKLIFDGNSSTATTRKDTNVLLTVDTENITEENKHEMVTISDDRSDSSERRSAPADHVVLVDKNMKIYWSAEALDPEVGTTVDVLGIFRKNQGGAEILDGIFRDPNKDGVVMGKIKNKKVEGLEYYNIMIRVNGDSPQTFIIDPKLKMSLD